MKKVGISRGKEGSWTKWFRDNANKYPARPETESDIDFEEWVSECLLIAGKDWCAYYEGPGLPFAHGPSAWIENGVLHIRQRGGWDI